MKFIVLEIQNSGDNISTLITTYDNQLAAESSYHTILAAAALSELPKHSCILMTEDGNTIKKETYYAGI